MANQRRDTFWTQVDRLKNRMKKSRGTGVHKNTSPRRGRRTGAKRGKSDTLVIKTEESKHSGCEYYATYWNKPFPVMLANYGRITVMSLMLTRGRMSKGNATNHCSHPTRAMRSGVKLVNLGVIIRSIRHNRTGEFIFGFKRNKTCKGAA